MARFNFFSLFEYTKFLFDEIQNGLIFILISFISLLSQIGDLIISYLKRLAKLKDTGKIIPGHGGLLDRIDGMIFAFHLHIYFNF